MSRRSRPGAWAGLLVLLVTWLLAAGPAVAADRVTLSPDRDRVDTVVGGRFTVRTTLTGSGPATGRLVAHLNVVSLSPEVYVDPEDWSTARSQWVDAVGPGDEIRLSWPMQAVNVGRFDVYVVLLPTDPADPAAAPVVSRPVHLQVSSRRTISAGGVLPVVVGVPALLGLVVVARARRRVRGATAAG